MIEGRICHGKPMRYESAEFTDQEGQTIRVWHLFCVRCGCVSDQQREVVQDRGPMDWLERHRADEQVSNGLAKNAPYYAANFPD